MQEIPKSKQTNDCEVWKGIYVSVKGAIHPPAFTLLRSGGLLAKYHK